MKKLINTHFNLKKMLCLVSCLLIGIFCCQLIISEDSTESATKNLLEERDQILDDLQKIESRMNALREQLMELEDSLLKKNERLEVVEGQISNFR